MLGQGQLKVRDSLADLIRFTRALANRSKTELLEGEDVLEDQLNSPFRITVCGEDGVGKTAFLEQLLDISLSDVKAASPAISIIRNSGYRVFKKEEGNCVKFYTRELKHVELVEVNGLSSLGDELTSSLELLLAESDYVFWMLPVENVWSASTWDLIERMLPKADEKSAMLLPMADQRDSAEIESLLSHIRELCSNRIGRSFPVVTVSAKDGRGVKECYKLVDTAISQSIARKSHLRAVYQQTFAMLSRTEGNVDERSRNLSGDQEYLQSIEAQIDRMRAEEVRRLLTTLSDLGGLLTNQIPRVMRYWNLRSGLIASHLALFGKGDLACKTELFLIELVSAEAESYAFQQAQRMRTQCRDKWNEMRPHLENRLAIEVGSFDEKSFDHQQTIFCEEMVKVTQYSTQHLKIKRYFDTLVTERFKAMRLLLKAVLVCIIAAGVAGTLSSDPLGFYPLAFAAVSVLILFISVLYARSTGVELSSSLEEALEDAAPALRKAMQEGYLERVRAFYNGYIPMFESMRRHVADAQTDLKPQQKIAAQLFLRMKSLEQEIEL